MSILSLGLPVATLESTPVRQSFAQSRLWFLHEMEPHRGQHNILVRMRFAGAAIDPARLAAAFNALVQRHQVLHTVYATTPGGPQQHCAALREVELQQVNFSGLDKTLQKDTLTQWLATAHARPFDLTHGPVLRPWLITLDDSHQELVFNIHHIAFDGRSGEILLADLACLYDHTPLNPVLYQYADFALWEPSYITPEIIATELAFWRDYVDGFPTELEFADRVRRATETKAGNHQFRVPAVLVDQLKASAKIQKQPLFTALITLFGVWIHYLSGQDRFMIGTDVHGRDLPELNDILGFFVNQLIFTSDNSGEQTLVELLARTRTAVKSALAHKLLPFDILVGGLSPQRQTRRAPFFQVKLNYQRNRFSIDRMGSATLIHTQVIQDLAGFDLVLDLVHGETGIEANLEYNRQLFNATEIERYAELWLELITQFTRLLDVPAGQLQRQLREWDNARLRAEQEHQLHKNRARLKIPGRKPLTV